ncbi:hypothetical protein CRUP_017858 [Coryphaenoides rupestris]|nr:hypothetical protein CRUP_017858 [Coryphaenoides rupestris]
MLSGEYNAQEKYSIFMRHRYNDFVESLLEHLDHKSYEVKETALIALMKLAAVEGQHPLEDLNWSEHFSFPRALLLAVVRRLLSQTEDTTILISRFQDFLEMADVRYYTMSSIRENMPAEVLPVYQNNVFTMLSNINMPSQEADLTNFMVKQEVMYPDFLPEVVQPAGAVGVPREVPCSLLQPNKHFPLVHRLARLALTAPPESLLMALPFIYNLIRRHPSCRVLIHRPSAADEPCEDPYVMDEKDPILSHALESSLWEIKTLQTHYHPDVAKVAMKINKPLSVPEEDIDGLLEITNFELMERDLKATKSLPLEFEPARKLLQGGGGVLGQHFCLA